MPYVTWAADLIREPLLLGDRSASCRTVEKLLTFSYSSISGDVESRLSNRGGKEECSNLFEQQTKLLR